MLNELEGVQLGPIFLQYMMLAIAVSVIIAYLSFSYLVKKQLPTQSEKIIDTVQMSIVIFAVTFKFLPLFMHPSYLLTPSKLLIYSGGPYANQISGFLSVSYFLFWFFREKWSLKLIDFIAVASFVFLIVNHLLIKTYGAASPFSFGWVFDEVVFHPLNIYYFLFFSLFLSSLFILLKKQKHGVLGIFILIAYFLTGAILSPFSL